MVRFSGTVTFFNIKKHKLCLIGGTYLRRSKFNRMCRLFTGLKDFEALLSLEVISLVLSLIAFYFPDVDNQEHSRH